MNEYENPNPNVQPPVQQPVTPEAAPVTPAPAPAPAYAPEQAPAWTAPAPQPVYAEQAPKKKKGGKAVLVILLILLLAGIAVGGFFLIKSLLNAPANTDRILQAYENTAKAALPSGMQHLDKEFAVDLTADLSKLPMDLPISGNVNAKINYENRTFGAELKANIMSITMNLLSLFASKDDLSIQSPFLIGNDAYGLSFKDAEANLSKSVLSPDSGSELALPQETYDAVVKLIPLVRNLASVDFEKVWNSVKNELWKEIDAMNVTEKKPEKVTVFEKEFDTNLIAIKMNGIQFCELIEKLLDWAENDPELAKVFAILDAASNQEGAGERAYLKEFRESLKKAKETGDKVTLTANGYIEKATGYLVRLEAQFVNENEESAKQSFKYDTRIENDFVKHAFEIDNGEGIQKSSTNWDKKTALYSIYGEGSEPVMTLEIKAENDSLTITPKTVNVAGVPGSGDLPVSIPTDLSFVTVKLSANAEAPSLPSYKDLLTMTQTELEALLQTIMQKLRSFGLGGSSF